MKNILSQTQIEDIARQYYSRIATAISMAFADYLNIRTLRSESGVVDFKARTSASLIHDCLKARLKEEIGENSKVRIGEFNGIFGLLIDGQVFIRFKKFNKDLTTSNIQTNQTEDYINQANFAGFQQKPTLLTAGYLPDASWTTIKNIYLVCRTGDQVIWHKDLTSEVKQGSIFVLEEKQEAPSVVRVSVKKQNKTGTDDK